MCLDPDIAGTEDFSKRYQEVSSFPMAAVRPEKGEVDRYASR